MFWIGLDKSTVGGVCAHMDIAISPVPGPRAGPRSALANVHHHPAATDFDLFYRQEFPRMVSLACTICGDYEQGEDLAQEAMTRAHKHWPKIAGYDRPGAWVRRVTINLALSRTRRVRRELSLLHRIAGDRSGRAGAGVGDQPRMAGQFDHGPFEGELDGEVWDAVRDLPPRQRAVVGLFYQEDLSTGEIAEVLGCAVSTATSHLNQARRSLAKVLGESLDHDPGTVQDETEVQR